MPTIFNSPWIRGSRHKGLVIAMSLVNMESIILPNNQAIQRRRGFGEAQGKMGAEIAGVGNCVAAVGSGRATRDSSLDATQSQAGKPN